MPIADVFEEYNRVGKENARKEKTTWSKFTLEDYKRLVVDYTEEHTDKVGLRTKINDIKTALKLHLPKATYVNDSLLNKESMSMKQYPYLANAKLRKTQSVMLQQRVS